MAIYLPKLKKNYKILTELKIAMENYAVYN